MLGDLTAPRSGCWPAPSTTWPGSSATTGGRRARGRRAAVGGRHCSRTHLYEDRTVVATSATLALGGHFDTVARSLGLPAARRPRPPPRHRADDEASGDAEDPAGARSTSAPRSTTRKQGILYVAAHLPRPTDVRAARRGRRGDGRRWCSALGGRTLGLFSSRRAAERAAEVLRAQTDLTDPAAGRGGAAAAGPAVPRRARQLPARRHVAVAGRRRARRRLPAGRHRPAARSRAPTSRWPPARSAAVDAAGGSGFAAVSVPIAAVRLAQGVGRLIRSAHRQGRGGGAGLAAGDRPRLRRVPAQLAAPVLVHDQARGGRGALHRLAGS